jgi:hypothetical protein
MFVQVSAPYYVGARSLNAYWLKGPGAINVGRLDDSNAEQCLTRLDETYSVQYVQLFVGPSFKKDR